MGQGLKIGSTVRRRRIFSASHEAATLHGSAASANVNLQRPSHVSTDSTLRDSVAEFGLPALCDAGQDDISKASLSVLAPNGEHEALLRPCGFPVVVLGSTSQLKDTRPSYMLRPGVTDPWNLGITAECPHGETRGDSWHNLWDQGTSRLQSVGMCMMCMMCMP